MNSEKIRIKVAEACGWRYLDSRTLYPRGIKNGTTLELPDYPNDLNACAEFEKTLTQDERITYKRFLYLIVLDDPGNRDNDTTFAMARQRCEAFLRTKGLWEKES